MKTLFEKLVDIERIENVISNNKFYNGDVVSFRRNLFERYSRDNEVLYNALIGKESLEETLRYLDNPDKKFFKKFLPYKKDEGHNKMVEDFKELISESKQLYHKGIFYPDNFLTATLEAGIGILILESINKLIFNNSTPDLIYPIIGAISYGVVKNIPRFFKLPYEKAKYLDKIIRTLY